MENVNYQRVLDAAIDKIKQEKTTPSLMLHCCCAPCSSYVLEYLSPFFKITVLYYNPNIYPFEEFYKRATEQKKLIAAYNQFVVNKIDYIEGEYNPEVFYKMAEGMEQLKEGGRRCCKCYELRLRETARIAKLKSFDFFTTTLTISPLKNSGKINEIGEAISEEFGVNYLFSDFKKKEGFKRSIELSKTYNLYRQNYCGCEFSQS